MYPYSNPSLFSRGFQLLKSIKWNSLLDSTGKTLGVINQAISVFYQIKPLIGNAKTLFKITNAITQSSDSQSLEKTTVSSKSVSNSPIFFIE